MSGPVLFEVLKRGGNCVRAAITEFRGSRFLDIREWAKRDGQLVATPKGVTVPLEALQGLGEALTAASRQIDSSGAPSASLSHSGSELPQERPLAVRSLPFSPST